MISLTLSLAATHLPAGTPTDSLTSSVSESQWVCEWVSESQWVCEWVSVIKCESE